MYVKSITYQLIRDKNHLFANQNEGKDEAQEKTFLKYRETHRKAYIRNVKNTRCK